MLNNVKNNKKTPEDIIAIDFKYEKIQENFEFIVSKTTVDESQMELVEYLSDFRDMNLDVLIDSKVFYIQDEKEIGYLTAFDEEAQYYLGFLNKNVDYTNRFVFPVMNGLGELNAWVGYDSDSKSKYMVGLLGVGDKKKLLYGIHDLKMAYEEDTIIANEGMFERLRLKSIGKSNAVSLLGKKMSKWQKQFLNRFTNKILIPDGDTEGQDMIKQWVSDLKGNVCVIRLKEESITLTDDEGNTYKKRIKDIDDKLRYFPERVEEFNLLYEKIKLRLKTEKYFEVNF